MEKWDFTTQQTNTFPLNPVEGGIPSSWSRSQEERNSQTKAQPGRERSMYCKELVFVDETEFSFEELRAQRYFKRLNEKMVHLSKVKEELKCQIEQKQKLLERKSDAIQDQTADVSCAPVVPNEVEKLKIYSEPEISRNSFMRNSVINHEDMAQGIAGVKWKNSQAPKSFTIHDENVLAEKHYEKPNTRSSSTSLKSLKLPTSILKSRHPPKDSPNNKDASLSHAEEAIVNAHWNKTLCQSPDDTCDFVRAAQLASTPFGGPGRQTTSERDRVAEQSINKSGSVIFREPNSEAKAEPNKLSPIKEISHEWGYSSLAAPCPMEEESHQRATTHLGISEVVQPASLNTVSAPALEPEMVNPCSLEARKALLYNVDLSSLPNFIRKSGSLPDSNDLHFDGETLFFLKKMGDQGMSLYFSNGSRVLVKLDESTLPWDFYINSQLRTRLPAELQHGHSHSTCYVYEKGSCTFWQVPRGQTLQKLLEDQVDTRNVPFLTIRLLEMVKEMHSCRLVHGSLKPETLMVCNSCEDHVICMDFSNSVDLELQTDVKTVQFLPSAQDYIKQGLLLSSASPYQVDLCGIAEIVHLLLFGKNMKIIKEESYWSLGEDCGPLDWQSALGLSNQLGPLWQDFFHKLLNPEDNSTEIILTDLINNLKNTLYEGLERHLSL